MAKAITRTRVPRKIAEGAAFHEGDIVTIYNQTISGRPFIEGIATVIGPGAVTDQYRVRFHRQSDRRHSYFRFVYPGECQVEPEAYLGRALAEFDQRTVGTQKAV